MGTLYSFECPGCGYSAEVSGGRDVGMDTVVQTATCANCRELVDVVIGWWGKDGPSGAPNLDCRLWRCPICEGMALDPWSDERPCPQCALSMEQGNMTSMWD